MNEPKGININNAKPPEIAPVRAPCCFSLYPATAPPMSGEMNVNENRTVTIAPISPLNVRDFFVDIKE